MKKKTKTVLIVLAAVFGTILVLLIGAIITLSVVFGRGDKAVDSFEEYMALCETGEYYPEISLDAFKDYDDIDFHYEQHLWALSSERWYRVILTYNDSTYAKQQEYFNETYDFISNASEDNTGGYSPDFSFGGFEFKTDSCISYPKNMLFIGFNETEKKICYLYFEDDELDSTDDFPIFFQQHHFLPE